MKNINSEIKNKLKNNNSDSKYTKEEIEYILAENAYLKNFMP